MWELLGFNFSSQSHQRAPSGDATKFKAMTQLDAEKLLAHELEKLHLTCNPAEKQVSVVVYA